MSLDFFSRMVAAGIAALLIAGISGCAGGTTHRPEPVHGDPLESLNRATHAFNEALDNRVAKPVARGYTRVVPTQVQRGVSNFFSNLGDITATANHLLQLRADDASNSFLRVSFNSTFGLGGLIDVATPLDIERVPTDFGTTLGRWGVPAGPYIVLPLLGSSTLGDATGRYVDWQHFAALTTVSPQRDRYAFTAADLVESRARLFETGDLLDEAAFDKYALMRDGYLQYRQARVMRARGADEGPDNDLFNLLLDEPLWDDG